ncbi:OmpH family outer membrane protein [Mucilaginibacter endophyticus]|uniref:OmpH family outer membrane protein n=1 Tax=Mucilaginibacter endophyticus TaxID=2675003 RepID=UPI000E0CCE98|nr:OmpH family outer membrane protein [Mucilaginibacter endophyticus]
MKLKIFSPALLTLIGLLTISTANFAQVSPAAPPPPPAKPVLPPSPPPAAELNGDWTPATNSKEYQEKMKELSTKMRDLQKQMNNLRVQQQKQIQLKMQNMVRLNKQLAFKFKDSMRFKMLDSLKFKLKFKDFDSMKFADKFEKLSPNVNFGFKNFDQNFSYNYDGDESYEKQVQNGDIVEKTKTYSKSYSIDGNDVINIDNKYGKVTVFTWAKSEVKVDVQIVVGANDEDKVQKMLDAVSIKDSKDGSGVSFRTSINQGDSDNDGGIWGSLFGKKNAFRKMEINYTVYMPARNPLTINNKYGNTELPDLSGKLNINNSYGSFRAKALTNPGNQIRVRYGSATIETLTGSDLDVAYGSLNLGDCDKLNADVSYGSAKIGRITTSGNINVKFSGALNIGEVDKNVKNLSVNSSYSSVKLGVSDGQNADFDITVHYGSFNYNGHDVNITSKTPADGERGFNPTKTYKGHLGKGGSDKTITISTSYGSVSFD